MRIKVLHVKAEGIIGDKRRFQYRMRVGSVIDAYAIRIDAKSVS